ncbi:Peroxisome biogenesis factor 2 [Aphelenchoides besseyi]|nr:Peroxisome biogenesis factor 2 [Aphelenchoides besseyi]
MVGPPALRVVELDSQILDDELLEIVVGLLDYNLGELSENPKWQTVYRNVKRIVPLLYYSHQYLAGSSPGQRLMDVYYSNFTRTRGLLNLLFNHLLPSATKGYIDETHNVRLQRLFQQLQSYWMLVKFAHLLFFLACGGPSNIVRRLLGIHTVYRQTQSIPQLNESALNRELLGHSIANVIILLTPLIKLLVRYAKEFVERRRRLAGNLTARTTPDGLILCDLCQKVVVVAISATTEDQVSCVYCSYCYHLAKRREAFQSFKLLSQ